MGPPCDYGKDDARVRLSSYHRSLRANRQEMWCPWEKVFINFPFKEQESPWNSSRWHKLDSWWSSNLVKREWAKFVQTTQGDARHKIPEGLMVYARLYRFFKKHLTSSDLITWSSLTTLLCLRTCVFQWSRLPNLTHKNCCKKRRNRRQLSSRRYTKRTGPPSKSTVTWYARKNSSVAARKQSPTLTWLTEL